jgi:hypothetical protein
VTVLVALSMAATASSLILPRDWRRSRPKASFNQESCSSLMSQSSGCARDRLDPIRQAVGPRCAASFSVRLVRASARSANVGAPSSIEAIDRYRQALRQAVRPSRCEARSGVSRLRGQPTASAATDRGIAESLRLAAQAPWTAWERTLQDVGKWLVRAQLIVRSQTVQRQGGSPRRRYPTLGASPRRSRANGAGRPCEDSGACHAWTPHGR